MCYEVKCSNCGKSTWAGCGSHVPSVYRRIPEGQHCLCHGWPGVKTEAGSMSDVKEPQPSNYCSIL